MPTFSPARMTAARIQAGLSQPRLGKRVDRTTSAIWTYETGKSVPPSHVVGLIAQALGVPVAALYEPDPDDPVLQALADLDDTAVPAAV